MIWLVRFLFLLILASTLSSQTTSSNSKPDVAGLLREVAEKYRQAKYYHIEAVKETQLEGELLRQWDKSITDVAMAPNNRYRFEAHSDREWDVKISDGHTEWILDRLSKLYTQKPALVVGPSPFKAPIYWYQFHLYEAQSLVRNLPAALGNILDPVFLEDETLFFDSGQAPCYVINGRGRYMGGPRDSRGQVTFWIDRETRLLRKVHRHMEGAIIINAPHEHLVQDEITIYPIAALGPSSSSDEMFKFERPAEAGLVDEFPDPMKSQNLELLGKMAAEVKLVATDGKVLQLSGFRGKPVLLDFWATWCAPCVQSLPAVEKIYREASGKGLSLISIDEDEEAELAAKFWSKRSEAWPNFHDPDGNIQREFAPGGIPEFVLIDADGRITYASSGLDEPALRSAIAKLVPDFVPVEAEPKPKP